MVVLVVARAELHVMRDNGATTSLLQSSIVQRLKVPVQPTKTF